MRALEAQLAVAQARLDELELELENAPGELPPPAIARLRAQVVAQIKIVERVQAQTTAAEAAYQAAVLADPMHTADPKLPLVLLPVRIETTYFPVAPGLGAGVELVVRVYPDDIHVDTHEPELTAAELEAGTVYWNAVWGAGPNPARLDAAWTALKARIKPLRAAWVVEALTPSVPRPEVETPEGDPQPAPPLPMVPTRAGNFTRAARTTLLPEHWHIIGFRDGQELFNVDGSPIPDSLDVSFGPPGVGAAASDLPFSAGSRWLVDLDAAVAVGMAVRIPLAGPDFSVDQLFVLGVSSSIPPAEGARRLQSALLAHQYTNGLGFLPPGTPTNNTTASRSAWQSAPEPPTPGEVEQARAAYVAASKQNAAMASRALGIDGTEVLCIAPHGLDDQQSVIPIVQRNLWPALGGRALSMLYTTWDVPPGKPPSGGGWHLHTDLVTAGALQDHMAGWVRSRGTLPVLRIGQQPYGLLPALSLDGWVVPAGDPTASFIQWLRAFRQYWLAGVGAAPHVVAGSDPDPKKSPDKTVVDVLGRLPVSSDVLVRFDGDPFSSAVADKPFPVAPIPGLPMNSELFYAAPAELSKVLGVKPVTDAGGDQTVLRMFQSLMNDGLAVLEQPAATQPAAQQAYRDKYKSLMGVKTFPGAPPPDLFVSLVQDGFTDPLSVSGVNSLNSMAAFIVCAALFVNPANPDLIKQVQQNLPLAQQYAAQFDELCEVHPELYDSMLHEILDVFSHRLDAWITSLAARRLDQLRAAAPTGVVIGAFGWVENLVRTDRVPVLVPPAGFNPAYSGPHQKFIHAPSLHHAATAAVLRAGYDSHAHPDALAVNLVSSRVRTADWLAAGVANGQTVGALLGYRFERGLHDAGLDGLIAGLRVEFPAPLPVGPDGDANGTAAKEAIAARNVVDGLALYRQRDAVRALFAALPQVGVLLDDLVNSFDALGDLLLAESVHHLVGGSPLRAGLAADTIGRGEPVPDRFEVVRTPRSGRPLSWNVGALLPAAWRSPAAGWVTNRPRARVEPHLDAWAANMLGPPALWRIGVNVTPPGAAASVVVIGLDSLGLCALDVAVEAAGAPAQLEYRIVEAVSARQPAGSVVAVSTVPAADGTPGFAELLSLAARIRATLGKASPLAPQHVQGPDSSPVTGLNSAELDGRIAALEASFSNAVDVLARAAKALDEAAGAAAILAAVTALRSALIGVADQGIAGAWPVSPADSTPAVVASLGGQAGAVLATVGPLAAIARPAAPGAGSKAADVSAWLAVATDYVKGITGSNVPMVPTFLLPANSAYAGSFAPAAAPVGADKAAMMAWLRRTARVRPNLAALHDTLLASEALSGTAASLATAQLPVEAAPPWVGIPFPGKAPPKARVAAVVSTPAPIDPTAEFCGFVCDNWTEQLPGLTSVATAARGYESSEVTGMSFSLDTPDASAPQCLLLAIAPDPGRGWSLDVLLDTVRETLDLAKIRTVDIGDLPRMGRVLPALHSMSNVDDMVAGAGVTP